MNAPKLIPVTSGLLNGQMTPLVDARLLHAFLEVRRDFSTWIKGRIAEFDFELGVDLIVAQARNYSPNWGNNPRGRGRPEIDYFLTLDMAKELAMVERTARGRQARRYFIDCERQLHRLQQVGSAAVKTCVVPLSRSQRQAINRQAWADVAGMTYAAFHARREALLREQVEAPDDDPVYLPPSFRPTWAQ